MLFRAYGGAESAVRTQERVQTCVAVVYCLVLTVFQFGLRVERIIKVPCSARAQTEVRVHRERDESESQIHRQNAMYGRNICVVMTRETGLLDMSEAHAAQVRRVAGLCLR